MLENIAILIVGLIVLIAGGELLVRGASSIAYRMKISRLVVGLTIVAFGTSSPELFISVHSALKGSADMAMGNVIGSNICNLGLVLGFTALIAHIPVDKNSIKIDWPVAMGSSLLLFAVIKLAGEMNWIAGICFVSILITYITYVIRKSRKETKAKEKLMESHAVDNDNEEPAMSTENPMKRWAIDLSLLAIGCAGLYFGSEWFVGSAEKLFEGIVEPRVIGLMVLAVGTSLPELATSMVAAYRKNTDLALGNLIGSNIFNVLSILGITSIIKPISVDPAMQKDLLWMLGITAVIFPLMWYKRKLIKFHGALLLSYYGYYVYLVLMK